MNVHFILVLVWLILSIVSLFLFPLLNPQGGAGKHWRLPASPSLAWVAVFFLLLQFAVQLGGWFACKGRKRK